MTRGVGRWAARQGLQPASAVEAVRGRPDMIAPIRVVGAGPIGCGDPARLPRACAAGRRRPGRVLRADAIRAG